MREAERCTDVTNAVVGEADDGGAGGVSRHRLWVGNAEVVRLRRAETVRTDNRVQWRELSDERWGFLTDDGAR